MSARRADATELTQHIRKSTPEGCFSDCQKNCPVTSIGGKDSVKGNRQGSLSRSITRRSDQNRKIKNSILFCDFAGSLSKKVRTDFFDKLKHPHGGAFCAYQSRHVLRSSSASRGISSRRPMSISSDSTSLLSGERMEKFSMGPRIPRPGPTLLMQVRDAAKDS